MTTRMSSSTDFPRTHRADHLSAHFSFPEMTTTEVRPLQATNRERALLHRSELIALCQTHLEYVRDHYDSPVIVTSGFRCPELNAVIGGSPESQHMLGQAADFHVLGVPLEDVFYWIWSASNLFFGQVILEGGTETDPLWIHLSLGEPYRDRAKSRQALRMINGVYSLIHQGGTP